MDEYSDSEPTATATRGLKPAMAATTTACLVVFKGNVEAKQEARKADSGWAADLQVWLYRLGLVWGDLSPKDKDKEGLAEEEKGSLPANGTLALHAAAVLEPPSEPGARRLWP
ncbi:hypothetical protein F53441_8362 [Fusarium austroafricanum]|uniref:Uncharacterized protein n=1 Tax=Fusarium austroafricanum TaxID=2364996 RepID=A0A8H4NXF5_9HYPO|nr:hypothetical protein F53441_8362 [Fusarium austroafricanum]